MTNVVVVGCQWGDEGKGKLVDYLSEQADIIVLFAKDVEHPDFGNKKHGGTTAFIIEKEFEGFSVGKKEGAHGEVRPFRD